MQTDIIGEEKKVLNEMQMMEIVRVEKGLLGRLLVVKMNRNEMEIYFVEMESHDCVFGFLQKLTNHKREIKVAFFKARNL